ncbi:hypothetical protein NC652_011943 [Populus alba x Populus x berolinensis]|uniref:Uncharacterized protein n=1 Tax=Populus alba x Populus x berolinensis TaxID=444605 RepID=A0AAD6W739_9ROSI|nr:hypothetical protein NC652_011943 [Populus alba x Populus x berolinensis]KAJ7001790.1 hypothetical protein NC653_012019 [Populus alba x Populus x berolinensis]
MAQCPLEGRVRRAVKKIRTTITSCNRMDLILLQKAIDQWQRVAFGSMVDPLSSYVQYQCIQLCFIE